MFREIYGFSARIFIHNSKHIKFSPTFAHIRKKRNVSYQECVASTQTNSHVTEPNPEGKLRDKTSPNQTSKSTPCLILHCVMLHNREAQCSVFVFIENFDPITPHGMVYIGHLSFVLWRLALTQLTGLKSLYQIPLF